MSPLPTRMCVAADTAAVRCTADGRLEVLLVQRGHEPFKGRWALPGGFVEENEDLPDGAARELEEETGLRPAVMVQIGAWGAPGRDPRGRTVSAVYLAVAAAGRDEVAGADDAAHAAWLPLNALPPLAFDHSDIVPAALAYLRLQCQHTHMAFAFLGESFSRADLERVLHALGCQDGRVGAVWVLKVAQVVKTGQFYRLKADILAPLREPVFLFTLDSSET